MYFRALGPLALSVDGVEVDVRPGRQPRLLACLLAHPNRTVRFETLAEALWPDQGVDPRDALRPVVSRVRRCLDAEPGGRDRLATRSVGYELRVEPDELDVRVFEACLQRAHAEALAGRFVDARRTFADALSGWRGAAYEDVADVALLQPEVARLAELRSAAVEDQVDVELDLGLETEVVATSGRLVADEPFRERRRAQLMLALPPCGRQAEALRAFRDARTLLADELGLEPSTQLVELEQRILRQDLTLHRGPTAADVHARTAGSASTSVEVALRCATGALGDPDRQAERHAAVREAAVLVRTEGDPVHCCRLAVLEAVCAVERFDGVALAAAHRRTDELVDRLTDPFAGWFAALHDSWAALLRGDVATARRSCARAFELGNLTARPDAWLLHHDQLCHLAWHEGRPADMLAAAVRFAGVEAAVDPRIAWASALAGRTATAARMLASARAAEFSSSVPNERLTDLCTWAATAAELGDRDSAERLTLLLDPWAGRIAATGGVVHLCVHHHLGRLAVVTGRPEVAQSHLELALRRHRQLRAPFFVRETLDALAGLGPRARV